MRRAQRGRLHEIQWSVEMKELIMLVLPYIKAKGLLVVEVTEDVLRPVIVVDENNDGMLDRAKPERLKVSFQDFRKRSTSPESSQLKKVTRLIGVLEKTHLQLRFAAGDCRKKRMRCGTAPNCTLQVDRIGRPFANNERPCRIDEFLKKINS